MAATINFVSLKPHLRNADGVKDFCDGLLRFLTEQGAPDGHVSLERNPQGWVRVDCSAIAAEALKRHPDVHEVGDVGVKNRVVLG